MAVLGHEEIEAEEVVVVQDGRAAVREEQLVKLGRPAFHLPIIGDVDAAPI